MCFACFITYGMGKERKESTKDCKWPWKQKERKMRKRKKKVVKGERKGVTLSFEIYHYFTYKAWHRF